MAKSKPEIVCKPAYKLKITILMKLAISNKISKITIILMAKKKKENTNAMCCSQLAKLFIADSNFS